MALELGNQYFLPKGSTEEIQLYNELTAACINFLHANAEQADLDPRLETITKQLSNLMSITTNKTMTLSLIYLQLKNNLNKQNGEHLALEIINFINNSNYFDDLIKITEVPIDIKINKFNMRLMPIDLYPQLRDIQSKIIQLNYNLQNKLIPTLQYINSIGEFARQIESLSRVQTSIQAAFNEYFKAIQLRDNGLIVNRDLLRNEENVYKSFLDKIQREPELRFYMLYAIKERTNILKYSINDDYKILQTSIVNAVDTKALSFIKPDPNTSSSSRSNAQMSHRDKKKQFVNNAAQDLHIFENQFTRLLVLANKLNEGILSAICKSHLANLKNISEQLTNIRNGFFNTELTSDNLIRIWDTYTQLIAATAEDRLQLQAKINNAIIAGEKPQTGMITLADEIITISALVIDHAHLMKNEIEKIKDEKTQQQNQRTFVKKK
jgi:hypothetical protein